MGKKKEFTIRSIKLGKLVHGGQALAQFDDGKKIFVWGGLPNELVSVQVKKQKKTYVEGIVAEVLEPSADRVEPQEPNVYLSTSPWQIMKYESENKAKQLILEETFSREGLDNIVWNNFVCLEKQYNYRNKMELGFWGDENGLHLAHYVRGTRGKSIVEGSALAKESINTAARDIRDELGKLDIWGAKLKTVVLRSSEADEVVAALFIKEDIDMSKLELPKSLKGLDIYLSDPKSPASIATKKLYSFGDIKLTDSVLGNNITYDVLSFFQVNLEVFSKALTDIRRLIKGKNIIDMYSGVGTIGIAVGATALIESDEHNIKMAKLNTSGDDTKVVHASSETALEYIKSDSALIVDPPRAGLHKDVIEKVLSELPSQIVYLSCNPSTQARDVKLFDSKYRVTFAQGYNFFPRTPHIESLVVLELKT